MAIEAVRALSSRIMSKVAHLPAPLKMAVTVLALALLHGCAAAHCPTPTETPSPEADADVGISDAEITAYIEEEAQYQKSHPHAAAVEEYALCLEKASMEPRVGEEETPDIPAAAPAGCTSPDFMAPPPCPPPTPIVHLISTKAPSRRPIKVPAKGVTLSFSLIFDHLPEKTEVTADLLSFYAMSGGEALTTNNKGIKVTKIGTRYDVTVRFTPVKNLPQTTTVRGIGVHVKIGEETISSTETYPDAFVVPGHKGTGKALPPAPIVPF